MDEQLKRLEALVTRLEKCTIGGLQNHSGNELPQISDDITETLQEFQAAWQPLCQQIGKETEEAAAVMFERMKQFAVLAGLPLICKQPAAEQLVEFTKPLLKKLPLPPRGPQSDVIKAIEATFDFVPFIYQSTPVDYLRETVGQVEYYSNRVRTAKDVPNGKEWAAHLSAFCKKLVAAVDQYIGNKKVFYRGSLDMAQVVQQAPCAQQATRAAPAQPQPADAGQAPPPPKPAAKPPKKYFDGGKKCHIFENIIGESIEVCAKAMESIQLFNCRGCNLNVRGKANVVSALKCDDSSLTVESVISQLNLLRCQKFTLRVTQSAQTISVENSGTVKIYLAAAAAGAEVNMFCSHEVKMIQAEEEEEREYLLPAHFVYKIENGRVAVKEVEVGTD